MQDLYKKITNANWAALSMEQNGHYKHALISWKDLNIYADHNVQNLNEETVGIKLTEEEQILLDELNKLRAEVETNYIASCKAMDRVNAQQQRQERLEREKEREREAEVIASSQQQQVQQYQNSVPTLRKATPHTLNSRKQGAMMLKSLRPGGITAYSTTSSNSNVNTPTQSSLSSTSTLGTTSASASAQHAANIIWAPSNSINVSNNSVNSLPQHHDIDREREIEPVYSPVEPTGPTDANHYTDHQNYNQYQYQQQYQHQISAPKKSSSDRAKAALKASAAVKYQQRPQGRSHAQAQAQAQYTRAVHNNSYARPSSSGNRRANGISDSSSPSPSPLRSSPKNIDAIDAATAGVAKLEVEEAALNVAPEADAGAGAEAEAEAEEDDDDEKVLKKIKGVDLKFAKNILLESARDQDKVYWSDIAGLEQAKETLMETVVYPFLRPDLFRGLREPVSGMLLFGPPGTGKTMLARAAATESNSTFFSIQSSSLTSKWYGESEKLVRALFQVAKAKAPSIIFVDEIDSLLGKRSGDGDDDTSRRLKNEFLVQWSDLSKAAAGRVEEGDEPTPRVLVLAATNLPWGVDEAARRRFVRRQYIPLPEPETRRAHFQKLLASTPNSLTDEDMDSLVELTEGYSGSDITSLAKDAAIWPIRELGAKMLSLKEVEIRPLSLGDFEKSMRNIRPSVNKEGLEKFEEWAKEFGSSGA
jgi:SpoVK/Ycf46/Vps4 family AAA+-type ATPase